MKKFLIFAIIAAVLGYNSVAYAADDSQKVEAGITPDSVLYTADKLAEDLQLLFTFDSQKDAELLLQFANERLSEAKEMTAEEKTEYVEKAVKDYTELMDEAEDKVTEVAADAGTTSEVKEDLSLKLEDAAQVDETIQNELGTEQQEQLEEKTTEVNYTANVVKNLDVTVVQALRETGMGFGQIAHTIALSQLSGKTVDEITALLQSGKGIGEISKEFGIHPSKINSKKTEVAESQDATGTTDAAGTTATTDTTATAGTATVLAGSTESESKIEAVTSTATAQTAVNQKTAVKVQKSNTKTIKDIKNESKAVKGTAAEQTTSVIQQETSSNETLSTDTESKNNEVKNNDNSQDKAVNNGKSDKGSKGKK